MTNDTFNYLAVLFSIIVGLAATELLQSIRGLLIARARVIPYAPSIIRSAMLLLVLAQVWWATFGLRFHLDWTFGMYAAVLLQLMLVYLVAALALPTPNDAGPVDLRAAYFGHSRLFYGLLAAAAVSSAVKEVLTSGRLPESGNLVFHVALFATAVLQAVWRNDLFHKIATSAALIAFTGYVVLLFDKLPQ